jgi:predicted small secreted protein
MRKPRLTAFILLSIVLLLTSCNHGGGTEKDYGKLVSAVMNAPRAVKGTYSGDLPPDFSSSTFLQTVKGKIPDDSYAALSHYRLEVIPKGSYYLLIVREPATGEVILFDYSCTFEVDGKVFKDPKQFNLPKQFDLKRLEQYDPCKSPTP